MFREQLFIETLDKLTKKGIVLPQSKAVSSFEGTIKASVNQNNPLKLALDLFITDFKANANNLAIPIEETDNIVNTALHSPIKANFIANSVRGHDETSNIGVITSVNADDKEIRGNGYVWIDGNERLADYLRSNENTLYTSWEVYYSSATKDDNGVSWLKDVVFTGAALVQNPAYQERARSYLL